VKTLTFCGDVLHR